MATMSPKLLRLRLLFLLLLFVLIGPAACNANHDSDPSEINDTVSEGQVMSMATASRGIKAALIHRDHYSLRRSTIEVDKSRSSAETLREDAMRTLKRTESLHSRIRNHRHSSSSAASSPISSSATSPSSSQDQNWDPKLTIDDTDYEYLMKISLGTPPQTFIVLADTGSDLNWVQCLPLQNVYNDTDPPFDPSKSSTYAKLSCASSACEFLNNDGTVCDSDENCIPKCKYSSSANDGSDCFFYYAYGSGATNGTLAEDTIHIDTVEGRVESVPKFSFGCAHNATDQGQADGLFGLGRGNISFPSQLGQYFGSVFSYCLVDSYHRESDTSTLIFGDDAMSPRAANGSRLELKFIPLVNGSVSSFYYVDVEGISVNGVDVSIPGEAFALDESGSGGTIFDSGTPVTRLVDEAFDPLVEALNSAITQYERVNNSVAALDGYELCYNASWDTWVSEYGKTVPTVSFNFANSSTFDLGVRNMWDYLSDEGIICLMVIRYDIQPIGSSGLNIFGNTQQADHYIVYDLENQRIGFVPADCTKLKN